MAIRQEHSDEFRLPVLLRQYFNLMGAKVCNLSLARDFNQITEILMAADLSRLPKDRLSFFIDVDHKPVYPSNSAGTGAMSKRSHAGTLAGSIGR